MLLAAATETMLTTRLCEALPTECATARPPLAGSSAALRQRLLLTLLFLGTVGVPRTWDLRGYTTDGLALLTGRTRAYGYRFTEAFLSQVASCDGAQCLTDALARWTTQLWHAGDETPEQSRSLTCYIDGLSLPVYTDALIPRGLVVRARGRDQQKAHPGRWCLRCREDGFRYCPLERQHARRAPFLLGSQELVEVSSTS